MKQGAKKSVSGTKSNSAVIRRVAYVLLNEAGGAMKLGQLKNRLEESLKAGVRDDYLVLSLGARKSRIQIIKRFALLKKKGKHHQEVADAIAKEKSMKGKKKRAVSKKGRLSSEEFTLRAIEKLKKPGYKGIHAVFSGFNEAFRKYFPGLDPVKEMKKLKQQGKIAIRPCFRGVTIYKPKDAPPPKESSGATLQKILG